MDVIVWQTGTARLLPRLLKGRKRGPLFLTDRRARVELPPCDIDPASGRARLSYRQAEALFKAASGGATLHQLRHSALTQTPRTARHADADGQERHTWSPRWRGTRGRPPRPWGASKLSGTRRGGGEQSRGSGADERADFYALTRVYLVNHHTIIGAAVVPAVGSGTGRVDGRADAAQSDAQRVHKTEASTVTANSAVSSVASESAE